MTKWERFGDDTWINTDHVEVVRVEEEEDGRWHLTASFASGRSYPIGSHDDRELLVDCTDALLRGQFGERLLALADPVTDTPVDQPLESVQPAATRRRWFRRSAHAEAHAGTSPAC